MKTINPFATLNKFYCIAFLLIFSCSPHRKQELKISVNMLYGKWGLEGGEKQVNYPEIEFRKDSTAVLYSKADTIYRFTFYTRKDSLYLVDINGKKYVNKIKKLTNSTIIFYGIADVDKEQTYKR